MYFYDDIDYQEERDEFIRENQQQVWDLWIGRYQRGGLPINPNLKRQIADMVEEWTGHPLMIEVDVPPPPELPGQALPPEDISF